MVLASAGLKLSESVVYDGCGTDADGTLPSKAAQYAMSIGFAATSARLPNIEQLFTHLMSGCPHPIVFVNLNSLMGISVTHAVIVESIDLESEIVTVIDPAFPPAGRRLWSLALFEIGWKMARCQTILVPTVQAA
jgi:ABC-type bacteriocin/lantibiotic exporter with double-glycine peptidase domain